MEIWKVCITCGRKRVFKKFFKFWPFHKIVTCICLECATEIKRPMIMREHNRLNKIKWQQKKF